MFSLLPERGRLVQAALLSGVMALAQAGQGAHWEVKSTNTDDPYLGQIIGYTPPVAYYEVGGYAGLVLMQTFPPPGNTVRIDGGTNGGSSIWMGGWLAYYYPRGMTGYVDSVGHSWEASYVGNCPTGQFFGPVSHRCRPICSAGNYLSKSFGGCRIRAQCAPNQSCDTEDVDDDQGQRCPLTANPVNTATGNKFQTEPDLTWAPGQTFTRYYNSGSRIDLGLGLGWRHSFSRRIIPSTDMAPVIAAQVPDIA
ncbi:DUF6531 domain-containing protein, partial [Andreprevotia sp. IGB-42]|uniref:DUF6531 domain-containing protein n=1 Tax=Andreprevotia sp. IGB-42 TaxID=2497473 RepID=UPI00191E5CB8